MPNPFAAPPFDPLTLDVLCAHPFYLLCVKNDKPVTPGISSGVGGFVYGGFPMHAHENEFPYAAIFQMRKVAVAKYKFWSFGFRNFASVIHDSYQLHDFTNDEPWSHFDVQITGDDLLTIRSIACGLFLSVVDADRIVRAAEADVTPWSKFRPLQATMP